MKQATYKPNKVKSRTLLQKLLVSTMAFTLATSPLLPIMEKPIVAMAVQDVVAISTLKQGDYVSIGGTEWIVLNPTTGQLMAKSKILDRVFDTSGSREFSPNNPSNIGYQLNHDYYNSLPTEVKEKIQTHTWGIGGVPFDAFHGTLSVAQLKSYENQKTVQAKVGLLSVSEWTQYSPHFKGNFLYVPSDMLTLTPYSPGSSESLWYAIPSGRMLNNSVSQKAGGIYPVVYLDPSTTVTKTGNLLDNLPPVALEVPDQVTDTQRNLTLIVNDYFTDPNFYDNNVFSVSVENENVATASLKVEGETTPSKFAGQRNQAFLTITPKAVGTTNVTLTANDGRGGITSQSFAVTVEPSKAPLSYKNLQRGQIIDFAGYEWMVLEPSTGYIIMKEPLGNMMFDPNDTHLFNPSDTNNIAYWLNNNFYNSLPQESKQFILSKTWYTGGIPWGFKDRPYASNSLADGKLSWSQAESYERSRSVTARIGIISASEWLKYSQRYSQVQGLLPNPSGIMFTRSTYTEWNYIWTISTNGTFGNGTGAYSRLIQPTLYLNTNLEISQNYDPVASPIPNQNIELGLSKQINLSDYFSDPNGDNLTFTTSSSLSNVATTSVNGSLLTINTRGQGVTTVTVTANDGKGGTVSRTFQVNVFIEAPTPPTMKVENNHLVLEGNEEDVKEMYYRINDGEWMKYTSPIQLDPSIQKIEAKAIDEAGNESGISTYEAPVSESLEVNIEFTNSTIVVNWEGTTDATFYDVYLNGNVVETYSENGSDFYFHEYDKSEAKRGDFFEVYPVKEGETSSSKYDKVTIDSLVHDALVTVELAELTPTKEHLDEGFAKVQKIPNGSVDKVDFEVRLDVVKELLEEVNAVNPCKDGSDKACSVWRIIQLANKYDGFSSMGRIAHKYFLEVSEEDEHYEFLKEQLELMDMKLNDYFAKQKLSYNEKLAMNRVETYENNGSFFNEQLAMSAISKLPEGELKDYLNYRMENARVEHQQAEAQKQYETAESHVAEAEKVKSTYSINRAYNSVNQLPDGVKKETLLNRLVELEHSLLQEKLVSEAVSAVERAEKYKSTANVLKADETVKKLEDGELKISLEERVQALKVALGLDDESLYEKALTAVHQAKKYPDSTYYYNKAVEAIDLVSDEEKQQELRELLEAQEE